MDVGDAQLLEQARRFDPDALRALHNRFYEAVYRYVHFKVRDPQASEDLASEVFVPVLEARVTFRGLVEALDAGHVIVNGISSQVVDDTQIEGPLATGARVLVEARTLRSGEIIAICLVVEQPARAPTVPSPTATPTPRPTATSQPTVTNSPTPSATQSPTQTATATP
jgi:hypothetical protein